MKAIVDQQLPLALVAWLENRGWVAWHVKQIGLEGANDLTIWYEAEARDAVILTKDEDFKVILRARQGPAIVWVRYGNCSNTELLARLDRSWAAITAALQAGERLIEAS